MGRRLKVWRERAGVISEVPVWCVYLDGYLYIHESFCGLVKQLTFERNNDKHQVG